MQLKLLDHALAIEGGADPIGVCVQDIAGFDPSILSQHGYEPPADFSRFVAKRKQEFLAGRWCAGCATHQVIGSYAFPQIGPQRAPVWVPSVVGSLTHTQELALALVAQSRAFCSIGVDLQDEMAPTVAKEVASQVLSTDERDILNQLSEPAQTELVFSMKETLFKALYPLVEVFFDFSDAKVVSHDAQGSCAELLLQKNLSSSFGRGQRFTVRYAWLECDQRSHKPHWLTWLLLRP